MNFSNSIASVKPFQNVVPYINERVFYSERIFLALYYCTCQPFSLNRISVNPEHWPIRGGCLKSYIRREDHPDDNDINKTEDVPKVNFSLITLCIIIVNNETFINILNSRLVFRSYA